MTVTWHGETVKKLVIESAMNGVEELSRVVILTDAKERCPVDSGTLRGTGAVERTKAAITVGFGGPAAKYAAVQHERVDFHHDVGEAKYLENAFNANISKASEYIKRHLDTG